MILYNDITVVVCYWQCHSMLNYKGSQLRKLHLLQNLSEYIK